MEATAVRRGLLGNVYAHARLCAYPIMCIQGAHGYLWMRYLRARLDLSTVYADAQVCA